MNAPDRSSAEARHVGWVTLGSGWQVPAAIVTVIVVLLYLPAHGGSTGSLDGLMAAIAGLYVVGLSVAGTRLVRGLILRAGGAREPIALLGRGPDVLASAAIRPAWRLAGLGAGIVAPLAAVVLAMASAGAAAPDSYPHAVASLALAVNAVIAAGAVIPAPGYSGWALLLALVDAAGATADTRVARAARLARLAGSPILVAGGILAALLGDPMLSVLGLFLGFTAWRHTRLAVEQDAIMRFLASHTAGDVARPITHRVSADEPAERLVGRPGAQAAVWAVEAGRAVLGAIGPRQLADLRGRPGRRCGEAMVPLGSLGLIAQSAPATAILPDLVRHGVVLVAGPDGLGSMDPDSLREQVRIWEALCRHAAARPRT